MTHNRTTRSLLVLLAGTAAVAAVIMTARPAGAAVFYPRCKTSAISLSLRHPVSSGGNTGVTITLRNDGAASCSLRGYPALGLELHGLRVKSSTEDGGTYFSRDPGPSVVVLAPGAAAKAHLSYGSDGIHGVLASDVTVSWHGAHWHRTARLHGAPVTIWRGALAVTAWEGWR